MIEYNINKKSCKEVIFTNKNKILKLPINEPKIILKNLVFLLSNKDTLIKSKKSKVKFKSNTKSKYIFIVPL